MSLRVKKLTITSSSPACCMTMHAVQVLNGKWYGAFPPVRRRAVRSSAIRRPFQLSLSQDVSCLRFKRRLYADRPISDTELGILYLRSRMPRPRLMLSLSKCRTIPHCTNALQHPPASGVLGIHQVLLMHTTGLCSFLSAVQPAQQACCVPSLNSGML